MLTMEKRIRVFFDADEDLKTAIELEAIHRGVNIKDLVREIIQAALSDRLKEARKIVQERKKRD